MDTVEPRANDHKSRVVFFSICSRLILVVLLAVTLSACLGGGSSSDNNDQADNSDPIDDGKPVDDGELVDDGDPVDDSDPIDDGNDDASSLTGMLFKSTASGGIGDELWISDGTGSGTLVLKDINPAGGDSEPGPFTAVGDTIFFAATTDADGREIWKTDGTEAGTELIKDIHPGPEGSFPSNLTAFDGELYFSAIDGSTGRELWKTDGTEAGTVQVRDIHMGGEDSSPTELTVFGNALYFAADDGTDDRASRGALWKTDGTEAGTQKLGELDLSVGISGRVLAEFKGALYFPAGERFSAKEIWRTDGTVDGTVQVTDIVDDSESGSNPIGLTVFDGELYFQAKRRETGAELWKTDGTEAGTVVVTNINPCDRCSAGSSSDSLPRDLTPFDGLLYFTAQNPDVGRELYKTDGTMGGTQLVKDIYEGEQSSISGVTQQLTVFEGTLYFIADDGDNREELWKTDGTEAGTQLVKDIHPNSTSSPRELTVFDGWLYLTAQTPQSREFWRTDGTEAGTEQVTDIDFFSFYPENTFVIP